jgi:hypothetical protein
MNHRRFNSAQSHFMFSPHRFPNTGWCSIIINSNKPHVGAAHNSFLSTIQIVLSSFKSQTDGGIPELNDLSVDAYMLPSL